MKRVDFDDYTLHEQPPEQPAESSSSKWILVVVAVIVSLAAIVLLRQPVSDAVRSHVADSQQDRLERKRQAEYQALERAVTSRTTMLADRLSGLERDIQEIATQFEKVTEVPLDRMHETATRRIDYMILDSDSFVTAWNQMKASRISSEDLDQCKGTLSGLRSSLHNGSLDPMDETRLDELLDWTTKQKALIETQRDCLKRMQNELLQKSSPSSKGVKGGRLECLSGQKLSCA